MKESRTLELQLLSSPTFARASRRAERDYVALIEAAYDLSSDDPTWMLALVRASEPILSRGLGASGFFWDVSSPGKFLVSTPTYVGCAPALHEASMTSAAKLTAAQAHALFVQDRPSKLIGPDSASVYPQAYAAYRKQHDSQGFLLVSSANLTGRGCALAAPRAGGTPASAGLGRVLDQVARHIAAGLRMRRAFREVAPRSDPAKSAQAILDRDGRLLHVDRHLSGRRERASFVEAARRLLDSRRARRSHPEEAVALWRALVLGRWSLVDHRDSDGKRLLLARRNEPGARDLAALNASEQRAAALFALLGSVKLVAYELGLAPSTVSEELKSASRKLGCHSRAELAGLLQPAGGSK